MTAPRGPWTAHGTDKDTAERAAITLMQSLVGGESCIELQVGGVHLVLDEADIAALNRIAGAARIALGRTLLDEETARRQQAQRARRSRSQQRRSDRQNQQQGGDRR